MIALLLAWLAQSGDAEAAAEAYQTGRLAEASLIYDKMLGQPGADRGPLHGNLGHCWLRQGRPAEALYHYAQASRHLPGNPDLRAARALAERRLGLIAPAVRAPHERWLAGFDAWTAPRALLTVGTLLSAGGIGLLLLRRRAWAWIPALLLVAGLLGAGRLAHRAWLAQPEGLVLDAAAHLRSAPHAGLPAPISLPPGTRVQVLEQSDRWLHIRHERGEGWTEANGVGLLEAGTR